MWENVIFFDSGLEKLAAMLLLQINEMLVMSLKIKINFAQNL